MALERPKPLNPAQLARIVRVLGEGALIELLLRLRVVLLLLLLLLLQEHLLVLLHSEVVHVFHSVCVGYGFNY